MVAPHQRHRDAGEAVAGGIVLASLLFGLLYQGGAELAFEVPTITREMVVMLQGLVILFSGALAFMLNPLVARLYYGLTGGRGRAGAAAPGRA